MAPTLRKHFIESDAGSDSGGGGGAPLFSPAGGGAPLLPRTPSPDKPEKRPGPTFTPKPGASLVPALALHHRAFDHMRAASQSSNSKQKPDPVTPIRSNAGAHPSRNTSYAYGTASSASTSSAYYPVDQGVRKANDALRQVSAMTPLNDEKDHHPAYLVRITCPFWNFYLVPMR
jgi:hypothetical protein